MTWQRCLLLFIAIFFSGSNVYAGLFSEFGAGYSREFRNNTDLEQYEFFIRQPLCYTTTFRGKDVATRMEYGLALLRDSGADSTGTARFSLMPQMVFYPRDRLNIIIGLGAGLMVGETEFPHNDLGGPIFFNSKLGLEYHLDKHWGIESAYYHQSNGGMYGENASLNMLYLACIYTL
jgi:hypothetical protein